MKKIGLYLISIQKAIALLVIKILLFPSSYHYHLLLGRLLTELNRSQAARSIALFASNSSDQFSSGAVYQYKEVVKWEGADLKVNSKLAKERIFDIFIKDEVLQYLQVAGVGGLLEIGCEAGQNLAVIREAMPEMKLAGCDISTNALSIAERVGIAVRTVNLLEIDALGVYEDDQFDYVLVSHVFEHLVERDIQHTNDIRRNVLKHIHRIARCGYIVTSQAIAQSPVPVMLSFLGHERVALAAFSVADLDELGVSGFFVTSNRVDQSLSLIVRK